MKNIIPFLMILLVLVGCSSGAATPQTGIPTAENEPTGAAFFATRLVNSPSSTPAALSSPAPSSTPAASTTPEPTLTSTPVSFPISAENQHAFEQNRRLGRGVNLGNALEAPIEGEWGVTLEESFFKTIADGGFNSVRIPIRWSAHISDQAPYTIDPVFLKRVDWSVDQALKNHLAVVINIHAFDAIMEQPSANKARFLAIWSQLAEHYKDYPDELYFELLNEPSGTTGNTTWLPYATEALQEIRKTNPTRMIIVGPGNWNNVANIEEMGQLPGNDRNLIVTFHYYNPFQFTHQGADWVNGSADWLDTKWTGSQVEKNNLMSDFDLAVEFSRKNQRPVFVGEFGAFSKADEESRHLWTDFVARTAEANGFSWAYWEFGSGFGAYDIVKKNWIEPIYSALIQNKGHYSNLLV